MPATPMRIQIVDDHLLFREGLAAILRAEADIEIISLAGSVREAVENALTARPEMILMDMCLPDGTGVDATLRILADYPACKIIFLTISDEDEHLMDAIRAGAKGYLLKDMAPSQLVSALRSVYRGEGALSGAMTRRLMEKLASAAPVATKLSPVLDQLTPREVDVLRVLTSGKTNLEIAEHLYISENTVRYHVHSILNKLGLSSRNEAARYARQKGLVM